MALVLKNGKKYIDPQGGEHSSAYAVVEDIICNKHKALGNIIVGVYANKAAKEAKKKPYERQSFICENRIEQLAPTLAENEDGEMVIEKENFININNFNDFLSAPAITPAGVNQYQESYNFIAAQGAVGGFFPADWESDEQ